MELDKRFGKQFGSISAAAAALIATTATSVSAKDPLSVAVAKSASPSPSPDGVTSGVVSADTIVDSGVANLLESAIIGSEAAIVPSDPNESIVQSPAAPIASAVNKLDLAAATRLRHGTSAAILAHGSHSSHASHYSSSSGGTSGSSYVPASHDTEIRSIPVPSVGSSREVIRTYIGISDGQTRKYLGIRKRKSEKIADRYSRAYRVHYDLVEDMVKVFGKERRSRIASLFPTEEAARHSRVFRVVSWPSRYVLVPVVDINASLNALASEADPAQKAKIEEIRTRYQKRIEENGEAIFQANNDEEHDIDSLLTRDQHTKVGLLQQSGTFAPDKPYWNQVFDEESIDHDELCTRSLRSVVQVASTTASGAETGASAFGFVVGNGLVLTSLHVVDNGAHGYVSVGGREGRIPVDGIAAVDIGDDLVLLSVRGLAVPALNLSNDSVPTTGAAVTALAFTSNDESTLMQGTVGANSASSGANLRIDLPAAAPDNGCGLILDDRGLVVGLSLGSLKANSTMFTSARLKMLIAALATPAINP